MHEFAVGYFFNTGRLYLNSGRLYLNSGQLASEAASEISEKHFRNFCDNNEIIQ